MMLTASLYGEEFWRIDSAKSSGLNHSDVQLPPREQTTRFIDQGDRKMFLNTAAVAESPVV